MGYSLSRFIPADSFICQKNFKNGLIDLTLKKWLSPFRYQPILLK